MKSLLNVHLIYSFLIVIPGSYCVHIIGILCKLYDYNPISCHAASILLSANYASYIFLKKE